jgi:hypothetical protein
LKDNWTNLIKVSMKHKETYEDRKEDGKEFDFVVSFEVR